MGKHSGHTSNKRKKQKNKKTIKTLMLLVLILIAAIGCLIGWRYVNPEKKKTIEVSTPETNMIENQNTIEPELEKVVQIYQGTERPIACMIDNHSAAWPQYSINKAYAVYEIIVEGGETRLMAVFKGAEANNVGPMRSSRHYFLDYALENDAIYAHIGWSPQAQNDIRTLGINNINGLAYDTGRSWKEGDVFWRINTKAAPHNSICDLATIKEAAIQQGYRTTSSTKSVLNYVTDEVTFEDKIDAISATDVTIPFSTFHIVNFVYDPTTQRYTRNARGQIQTDATDNSNITTKNIIITKAANYTLNDGSGAGRQELNNTGTKEGYYITNGKAIPITCTKSDRASQTIYKDTTGKEIEVNDGNTFFEICPADAEIVIK